MRQLFAETMFREVLDQGTRVFVKSTISLKDALRALAHARMICASRMRFGNPRAYATSRTRMTTTEIAGSYRVFRKEALQLARRNGGSEFCRVELIPGGPRRVLLTKIVCEGERLWWIHTPPRNIGIILEYCEGLFSQALKAHTDRARLVAQVAELHWWLAHAAPFDRGSASITDALTKAIFIFQHVNPGCWLPEVAPDVKAFHTPRLEFVRTYKYLFETA